MASAPNFIATGSADEEMHLIPDEMTDGQCTALIAASEEVAQPASRGGGHRIAMAIIVVGLLVGVVAMLSTKNGAANLVFDADAVSQFTEAGVSAAPQCNRDTGGSCKGGHCWDWRRAKCVWSFFSRARCLCPKGQCAKEGTCVAPMSAPSQPGREVAVVGCGIAGALTALELAHKGVKVSVFDRESDCGVDTSGRIAAEMMFYSYNKAFFHDMSSKVESAFIAVANQQAGLSVQGAANAGHYKKKMMEIKADKDEVEIAEYRYGSLTFKAGSGSPEVVSVSSQGTAWNWFKQTLSLSDVRPGWQLEEVTRDVKQVTPYDLHDCNIASDVNICMQKLLSIQNQRVKLTFVKHGRPRTNTVYGAGFFEAAGNRLRDFFLEEYPELCEAVVSPFCCVPGSKARAWVEKHPNETFYKCPADPYARTTNNDHGMGVAHVFTTDSIVRNMFEEEDEAKSWNFQLWDAKETHQKLSSWIEDQKVYGGAINRRESGFVRTELVFKVIRKILERKGVKFYFKRELSGVAMGETKTKLHLKPAGGKWETTGDNVLTFFDTAAESNIVETKAFDRVVISTGAAVNDGLDNLDPTLRGDHLLLPVRGYIILGPAEQIPFRGRDVGVVYENEHMYLRSTRDGKAAIGGGMYFGDGTDEDVRASKWHEGWTDQAGGFFDARNYMSQATIGKKLMDDSRTLKMGGCRPMSVFGNFPLLKSYGHGRVILNTGGGANGFVTSWKSGQLAAEFVQNGAVSESIWKHAVTDQ